VLPQSHIAFTAAAITVLKDKIPAFKNVDYRLLALVAMGPDLIDKPLAVAYFYRKYGAAVLFAHTLIVHLSLFIYTLWKKPKWWPYALAFNGHAILDRLWFFKQTWYWPLAGWRFTVWKKEGNDQIDIKNAYWHAFTTQPEVIRWEIGGLLVGLWFVIRHKLYDPQRLVYFISSGKLKDD